MRSLTFGLRNPAPASTTVAHDVFSAVIVAVTSDAGLTTSFGRTNWLWQDLAPPATPLPRAVWVDVGGDPVHEAGRDSFGNAVQSWVDPHEYQLTVHASSKAQAHALVLQILASLSDAAGSGQLVFGEAQVGGIGRIGACRDWLDENKGRDGNDVWNSQLPIRAIITGSD